MPEQFSVEDLSKLNDLRRRIANEGTYNEDEVAEAIALFRDKREEAAAAVKKAPAKKKAVAKAISLDDLV